MHFDIDIGSNRFYTYAVGGGSTFERGGIAVLSERNHTSPLLGPLPEQSRGRTVLDVPADQFDREHRHVQLMSFRTQTLAGPAVSDVVRVPPGTGGAILDDGLPEIAFATSAPFRLRERPPLSEAQFLSTLTTLISSVAPVLRQVLPALTSATPQLASVVGALLGGGTARGPQAGPAGGPSAPSPASPTTSPSGGPIDPEIIELLTQLARQVAAASERTPAPATATSFTPAALGSSATYSRAMNPALLALIPALAPLLEKVLNPETIKAILGAIDPNKLLGTAIKGVTEVGKLGIESAEQDLRHLRAIHPDIDDPALDRLLESLSVREAPAPLRFRRAHSTQLHFVDQVPVTFGGRARLAYRHGRALGFPVQVETPRPIPKAFVVVEVQDPERLTVLARHRERVENVTAGRLSVVPALPPGAAARLEPGRDYLVTVSLVWRDRSGERVGASRGQLVTMVGAYAFDRIEASSALVPLNDVQRHRAFWHRIWNGSFGEGRKRVEFDARYYVTIDPARRENARLDTVVDVKPDGEPDGEPDGNRSVHGRLKAGIELSVDALNALSPSIGGGPPLPPEVLDAFRSEEVVAATSSVARSRLKLRGRSGESGAVWVFPEVKLHPVVLRRVDAVDDHGHVTAFSEHGVTFPFPALVHFVGARTER